MGRNHQDMTTLLTEWRGGNEQAGRQLVDAAYSGLRRLAAYCLRSERPDHTLQATALVHELYVRLFSGEQVEWRNRAHFFAVAAQQLRRILVDYARAAKAEKRGGQRVKLSLTDVSGFIAVPEGSDMLDIDAALTKLEQLDPRAARGVELRFFAGLKETEIAEVLGISLCRVRDWRGAELSRPFPAPPHKNCS